ncbi:MAG: phosphatidylglycerophosphatase A [Planctomycetota bacterium]|nr:MAG: phosphatidylglycerophosphatase A [Planctomycetota bacterium]
MRVRRLLTSCFGLGYLPIAPGTWGSLPAAIVFGSLCKLGASSVLTLIVTVVLACAGCVVCVKFAPAVIAATGKTDPREVVADELAGQAITFLAIPFLFTEPVSAGQIWFTTALGFLLFRILDIAKPWPIRRLEKLPEGWGVLADDLMAGVYAAVVLAFCVRLWIVG